MLCILEEVVGVKVSSGGGVIHVGQETVAWSLWVWDTRGAKREMQGCGRQLSDSASVPAGVAERGNLPVWGTAMLVITAAKAVLVPIYAFPTHDFV